MSINPLTEEKLKSQREDLYASLKGFTYRDMEVPQHIWTGLVEYITTGRGVGDFLSSVINNDLKGATGQADNANLRNLPATVAWLYNNAPSSCWGYPDAYDRWQAQFQPEEEEQ